MKQEESKLMGNKNEKEEKLKIGCWEKAYEIAYFCRGKQWETNRKPRK